MQDCFTSWFTQSWLWLAIELFHQSVPLSSWTHVRSMSVAHSLSCTPVYLNLLSSCLRRASCQAWLEGICSKSGHKLHFESITRSGRFTGLWEKQEAWVGLCSPVAVARSREPWAGWWGAPHPSAVSGLNAVAAWCHRWKGALTEILGEMNFLNLAFPILHI